MKCNIHKPILIASTAAALSMMFCMTALAEVSGHLDWANQQVIAGWAWDDSDPDQPLEVHIDVTPTGTGVAAQSLIVTAESQRVDPVVSKASPNHGFYCPVDWSELSEGEFRITAYVISDGKKVPLRGAISYDTATEGLSFAVDDGDITLPLSASQGPGYGPGSANASKTSVRETKTSQENTETSGADSDETAQSGGEENPDATSAGSGAVSENTEETSAGPGAARDDTDGTSAGPGAVSENTDEASVGPGAARTNDEADEADPVSVPGWKKGASLGIFSTTGFCNCPKCSKWGLTYSGTVPKANHTIAADLSVLPLWSKVMINGIVYTVEDIGSGVVGTHLDIYYDSHEAAWNHGRQYAEVFAVIEE